MSIFLAKTLVNSLMYKQNKSLNHINHYKTDKLFTINNPFSFVLYIQIHNENFK